MLKRIAIVLAVVAGSLVGTALPLRRATRRRRTVPAPTTNMTFGAVIVQPWHVCRSSNSTITGSVTVKPNAAFETCDDLIKGSVNATQAYVNIDNGTEVDGSITLLKPGTELAAGDRICDTKGTTSAYSSYLCPNYIGGNLNIQHGPPGVQNETEVGDCGWVEIHGSFTISDNRPARRGRRLQHRRLAGLPQQLAPAGVLPGRHRRRPRTSAARSRSTHPTATSSRRPGTPLREAAPGPFDYCLVVVRRPAPRHVGQRDAASRRTRTTSTISHGAPGVRRACWRAAAAQRIGVKAERGRQRRRHGRRRPGASPRTPR